MYDAREKELLFRIFFFKKPDKNLRITLSSPVKKNSNLNPRSRGPNIDPNFSTWTDYYNDMSLLRPFVTARSFGVSEIAVLFSMLILVS